MGKWISVNDRLPDKAGFYLVYFEDDFEKEITVSEYNPKRERCVWTDDYEGYCDFPVTHWMPLPEPPKEDEL